MAGASWEDDKGDIAGMRTEHLVFKVNILDTKIYGSLMLLISLLYKSGKPCIDVRTFQVLFPAFSAASFQCSRRQDRKTPRRLGVG